MRFLDKNTVVVMRDLYGLTDLCSDVQHGSNMSDGGAVWMLSHALCDNDGNIMRPLRWVDPVTGVRRVVPV